MAKLYTEAVVAGEKNIRCSYYHLEARYMAEIAKQAGQAERTVQIKYRDDVEIAGHPRPNWTAKDADNAIAELDG